MAKKNLRKVHIDGREWKYYIQPKCRRPNLVIFNPNSIRHEVTLAEYHAYLDKVFDYCEIDEGKWPNITPSDVKNYISRNFISLVGPI